MPRRSPVARVVLCPLIRVIFLLVTILCVSTFTRPVAADPTARAVLVVDGGIASDPGSAPTLRTIVDRLASDWRLVSPAELTFLVAPDPECNPKGEGPERLVSEIREGMRRYYQDTDLVGAAEAFERALDGLELMPCALVHRPRDRAAMATAGLLLVRIHHHAGRTAEARVIAGRLCGRVAAAEIARADVPPDVKAFVEAVRWEQDADAVPLGVKLEGVDGSGEARLLIDGIEADGTHLGPFRVVPGRHAITVLPEEGDPLTVWVDVGSDGLETTIDLDLSRAFFGGAYALVAVAPRPALLDRLAARSDAAVLHLTPGGDGAWRVVATPPVQGGFRGDLLRTLPRASGPESLTLLTAGPMARRRPWAWPWVTGAMSVGLLSAGVTLNVLANRNAGAVNTGTNRLDDLRAQRAGSIACYTLAAATALSTVILGVVRRPASRETLAVTPLDGGAAIGVGGAF